MGTFEPQAVPAIADRADERIFGYAVEKSVAVRSALDRIKRIAMQFEGANEIWINRPGEMLVYAGGLTHTVSEPTLTFQTLQAFATAVAVYVKQTISSDKPLLSATLPDGERVQIVMPPACERGHVLIAIRIHGDRVLDMKEYVQAQAFNRFAWSVPDEMPVDGLEAKAETAVQALNVQDQLLLGHLVRCDLAAFLVDAVRFRKTLAIVGNTGSGKTTLMKALCQHIPLNERLITIEDVRELLLPLHGNRAHLLYAKNSYSSNAVTPSTLIGTCMRLAPSRVLLAELRGSEAWDFLKLLTTGHAGSITSFHAESCSLALERFMFMAKENAESSGLSRDELHKLVAMTVDVVVHITGEPHFDAKGSIVGVERYVDEVMFDPFAKMRTRFGPRRVLRAPGATA